MAPRQYIWNITTFIAGEREEDPLMTNYSYKDFLDRGNLKIPSWDLLPLWSSRLRITNCSLYQQNIDQHRGVIEVHLPHPPHGTALHQKNVFICLSFTEISRIVKRCYGVTLTTFNQMRINAKHFIQKYPNHSKPTLIKISLNNMRAGGDDQITSH